MLQAPLIIEQDQFLALLPGSFGLFKRQFHGTRSSVDHSIGNFVPFSLNSIFQFFLLFVYIVTIDLFEFHCA